MAKTGKSKKKLQRLFDVQLQWAVDDEEVVVCPLTLEAFTKDEIDADPPRRISVEHAPQTFSGQGIERCITASGANNRCGFEARAGLRVKERRDGLAIDLPLGAPPALHKASGSNLVTVSPLTTHKHVRKKGKLYVPASSPLDLDSVTVDEELVELKNGLILAFVTLGHRCIIDPAFNWVREVLFSPQPRPLGVCGLLSADAGLLPNSIYVANLNQMPVLLVCTPAVHATASTRQHVVILPRPGSPNLLHQLQLWKRSGGLTAHCSIDLVESRYEIPAALEQPRHWDQCDQHSRAEHRYEFHSYECDKHGRHRFIQAPDPCA